MKNKHKILYKELCKTAIDSGVYEFEFIVQEWGIMWYPWYIYFEKKELKSSINQIDSNDFIVLIDQGLIKVVKEYKYEELTGDLDFSKTRYKIIKNVLQHGIKNIGHL